MADPVSKFDVWVDGLVSTIGKIVRAWEPGNPSCELACRDSLYEFMLKRLPDARITKEYRDGGATRDIHVFWQGVVFAAELFIEIKLNLVKHTEFERLVGQITNLEPTKRRVMVVLCGSTEPHFFKRLHELFGKYEDTIFDGFGKVGGIDFIAKDCKPVPSRIH